ncbi:spore cortex biosynthesis protein YabQ [Bacillus aquiflavi]|uniref:Spore cortex biosynthesis protein YabQ n=1 Tax=Bacillus aquiflavi TaxID=2672567 RepID=A0A6B3W236_9BACI|nr:spore cortex biosynthesis protein YabQ [Bacillus aquiflavi]MBA4538420.1 spore cortex biosynthesis protein YabQ [Bacillus aquiflavi]NEY82785.1 spore cortex biosynthesis protein YabQ [Bacillus aquiflavi]UAC48237.1 spore cortex biosynthesis protein YabQ [Bacillus aquiflavi]
MTLSSQFITMLSMIGMGSFFGAAFDTYNRFLQRSKRNKFIVFINDILFWLLQALIIFYVLFIINQGEIRFYIFLALLCGFAAYQSLLKGIYLYLLGMIISISISIFRFHVKAFNFVIFKPIYWLTLTIFSIFVVIGKGLFGLVRMFSRMLIFLLKIITRPFKWMGFILWELLPKGFQSFIKSLYNKGTTYTLQFKNKVCKWAKFNRKK